MFWKAFPTKKSAEDAVRKIVNSQGFNIAFESPLISDLVVERHYFCSRHGLRPRRFRKLHRSPGYSFEGDFSGLRTPRPIAWHGVSWTQCLAVPKTDWSRLVRAMRDRIEPEKARYKREHPLCEACRVHPTEEAHHETPTFDGITGSVRNLVDDAEIAECLAGWDWFLNDSFALPEGNKITTAFDQIHATATLRALCTGCHKATRSS